MMTSIPSILSKYCDEESQVISKTIDMLSEHSNKTIIEAQRSGSRTDLYSIKNSIGKEVDFSVDNYRRRDFISHYCKEYLKERAVSKDGSGAFGDDRMILSSYTKNRVGQSGSRISSISSSTARASFSEEKIDIQDINNIARKIEEIERSRISTAGLHSEKAMISAIENLEFDYSFDIFDKEGKILLKMSKKIISNYIKN